MITRRQIPMTPEGHRRLHEELKKLKAVDRPKNVADIEHARSLGDLSENAEYHAAKEKQGFIASRIAEIENKLAQAHIIDPSKMNHQKVVFGATVKISDINNGEEIQYQIVGADESDVRGGKISIESPIAKSLIGKEKGDTVKVSTPKGTKEFEILEIRFE
ncbi:MAG: transcription elongation factor GreA [Deltaproteobacteria bacterium]|nr:transcription elongation factor GreA [Deltaproteobacteria bacterium]